MADHVTDDIMSVAEPRDVSEIVALARSELPFFPALHSESGWQTHNRFGPGESRRGNCTLVLRDRETGALTGFIWADDAMYIDCGVVEPWWCINAVAVVPEYRGSGRASALVGQVEKAARRAGVALIYGLSVQESIGFWQHLSYITAAAEEPIRTHSAARRAQAEPVNFTLAPEPGSRWFVRYLATTAGSVRSGLLPASRIAD